MVVVRALLVAVLASSIPDTTAHAQVSFEEKRLLTVPLPSAGWLEEEWEPIVSEDGRRAAAVVPLWKGRLPRRMYHTGALGKQICYLLIVDGKTLDPCSWSSVPPAFSRDGRHVMYTRRDRDGSTIFLDNAPIARPAATPRALWMMADGRPGYLLEEYVRALGSQRIVVGAEEDPRYRRVSGTLLSPDGSTLAYIASGPRRQSVVVRGRSSFEFANVHEIVWTPDGREVVVLARSAKCDGSSHVGPCWCISRGKDCAPEPDLYPGTLVPSPDGRRIAVVRHRSVREDGYQPGRDDRFWMSYGAFRGPEVRLVTVGPVLDASGGHVGYAGRTAEGGVQVFRDAQPLGRPVAQVNDLSFSSDGSQIAWTGGAPGHFRAFLNGLPGAEHEWTRDVTFDPTGQRVAYAARDTPSGPWRILAGNLEGPACDWVSRPHWSADGKRIAYAARIGRELWWKILELP